MHENLPPIPYPGPSPKRVKDKSDEVVFKWSFWKFFIATFVYWIVTASIGLFPILITDRQGVNACITVAIVIGAVAALVAVIGKEVHKVAVSPSYVSGYGFWGSSINLRWQKIKTVRPINFAGLRYLRLYSSRSKRVLWLPLFLQDKKGFKNAVTQFAPPENPLRRYLEANTK